jgi:hypothetical protein
MSAGFGGQKQQIVGFDLRTSGNPEGCMTTEQFIENELIQLERKAERWIGAIKNQLALPAEQRVTIFTSEQLEAEILNNSTWLAFVREARERFQAEQEAAA